MTELDDTFPDTACQRCGELAIQPVKLNSGGYECPNCHYGSGEENLTWDDFTLVFRGDVLDNVRDLLNDLEEHIEEDKDRIEQVGVDYIRGEEFILEAVRRRLDNIDDRGDGV